MLQFGSVAQLLQIVPGHQLALLLPPPPPHPVISIVMSTAKLIPDRVVRPGALGCSMIASKRKLPEFGQKVTCDLDAN
ncbi:MAG: hypothetical protein A2V79_02455 [Betaproteobacteria bacterium RBG_16_56_24]|nr:MAG: hypothetical protein A2V79_02455 [Betaproteobacteria bacterium RBG_16_56_24]